MSDTSFKNSSRRHRICSGPFAISGAISLTFVLIRDRRSNSRLFAIHHVLSAIYDIEMTNTFLEKCIYECGK